MKKTNRKTNKKSKRLMISFVVLLSVIVLGITFVLVALLKIQPLVEETIYSIDAKPFEPQSASTLYYWNEDSYSWEVLDTLYREENRKWIGYDDLPKYLVNAAVAIEDRTFWEHKGINWPRTFKAAFNYIIRKDLTTAGGSTITQQVIKNLTGNRSVSASRKILEIIEAIEFERAYSKEEIIELYLNNIYLGSGCYGIYAAAHKYFDKEVEDLSIAEAACLISITNNPSYYDPYRKPENVKYRAAVVLNAMNEQGLLDDASTKRELESIGYSVTKTESGTNYFYDESKDTLMFVDGNQINAIAGLNHVYSWYIDAVLSETMKELQEIKGISADDANELLYTGGLKIYTAFDPKVQEKVDEVYSNGNLLMSHTGEGKEECPQSAITVISNASGAVIALAGGLGEKTDSRIFNRATEMFRQPGSSIKPLSVYGPALSEGVITLHSTVVDSPFKLDENGNNWPVNAYRDYWGTIDIYRALVNSSNTAAVKILDQLGLEKSYEWMTEKLHFSNLVEKDIDHPSLALGGLTNGVSVEEMAAAFSVFARDGVYVHPYLYSQISDQYGNVIVTHGKDKDKVFSDYAVMVMNQLLEGVVKEGTGVNAQIEGVTARGKTGTSQTDGDLWFCGYTDLYTAAVWTGYDDNTSISHPYPNPSAKTWKTVMQKILEIR